MGRRTSWEEGSAAKPAKFLVGRGRGEEFGHVLDPCVARRVASRRVHDLINTAPGIRGISKTYSLSKIKLCNVVSFVPPSLRLRKIGGVGCYRSIHNSTNQHNKTYVLSLKHKKVSFLVLGGGNADAKARALSRLARETALSGPWAQVHFGDTREA